MKITEQGFAVLENDSHIGRWVHESGKLCHDLTVIDRIVPLIPGGGVVIDAGANVGDHTVAYAEKVGPLGRVLAFEPHAELFQCLSFNMAKLSWVSCYRQALGAIDGRVSIAQDDTNAGGSHVTEGGNVQQVTIDSLALLNCDLIKLDIEGSEHAALEGAHGTLYACKPILVIEINHGALARFGRVAADIFGILNSHGYKWEPLAGVDDLQYDIVARPT